MFASNELPKISFMEMQSYMSRAIIFPFRNVIDRKHWRLDFEENLHADIAGIVNFAIKGLKRLEEDNFIINETDAMKNCKQEYTGRIDSFSMFCDKYIKVDANSFTPSSLIAKAYQEFCDKHEYEMLQNNQWPQVLKRQFRCKAKIKSQPSEDNAPPKSVRGYEGIVLSKKANDLINTDKVSIQVFDNHIKEV